MLRISKILPASAFLVLRILVLLYSQEEVNFLPVEDSPVKPLPELLDNSISDNNLADINQWYTRTAFEGALIQSPYIINLDTFLLFTDNSRIQSFKFSKGILWEHNFQRVPWSKWFPYNDDVVFAIEQNQILAFSELGLFGRSEFLNSQNDIQVEHIEIVNGRLVHLNQAGTLCLYADLNFHGEPLLCWIIPRGAWENIQFFPESLILEYSDQIIWYGLDGELLAQINFRSGSDSLSILNMESILITRSTGNFEIYSLVGEHLYSGRSPGQGRMLGFIPLKTGEESTGDSQPGLYLHKRASDLVLYTPSAESIVLLRFTDPWDINTISQSGEYLFISDTLWQMHRFDYGYLAKELLGIDLDFSPPPPQISRRSYLSDFLLALDSRTLEIELEQIADRAGKIPGGLLDFEQALLALTKFMYSEDTRYPISDPRLRLYILSQLFRLGGSQSIEEGIRYLRAEVNPGILAGLSSTLWGKSPKIQIMFLMHYLNFLNLQSNWWQNLEFVNTSIQYLSQSFENLTGEQERLRQRIADTLVILYGHL